MHEQIIYADIRKISHRYFGIFQNLHLDRISMV